MCNAAPRPPSLPSEALPPCQLVPLSIPCRRPFGLCPATFSGTLPPFSQLGAGIRGCTGSKGGAAVGGQVQLQHPLLSRLTAAVAQRRCRLTVQGKGSEPVRGGGREGGTGAHNMHSGALSLLLVPDSSRRQRTPARRAGLRGGGRWDSIKCRRSNGIRRVGGGGRERLASGPGTRGWVGLIGRARDMH